MTQILEKCADSVSKHGFILAVEKSTEAVPSSELKLDVCFDCTVKESRVLLLRKVTYPYNYSVNLKDAL